MLTTSDDSACWVTLMSEAVVNFLRKLFAEDCLMSLYGGAELAHASRVVRKNTIQIAQDIPEESYDFVPAPGTRSVSQLLRHIAFLPTMYYDMHRDKRLTTLKGYDFP